MGLRSIVGNTDYASHGSILVSIVKKNITKEQCNAGDNYFFKTLIKGELTSHGTLTSTLHIKIKQNKTLNAKETRYIFTCMHSHFNDQSLSTILFILSLISITVP